MKEQQSQASSKVVVVLIRTDEQHYWLMMTQGEEPKTYCILGFPSVEKGLAYFTDAYNRNHDRSYEASMSACINYIFYQPSICVFDSVEDIPKKLFPNTQPALTRLSNVSGSMDVIGVEAELAKPIWEAGQRPELITPKQEACPQI